MDRAELNSERIPRSLAAGFANESDKETSLQSKIPRSLLRGALIFLLIFYSDSYSGQASQPRPRVLAKRIFLSVHNAVSFQESENQPEIH